MLVGLNDYSIQRELIKFGFKVEYPEDVIKNSVIDPLAEATVYRIPRTTPECAVACNPDHPIKHGTVIFGRSPGFSGGSKDAICYHS